MNAMNYRLDERLTISVNTFITPNDTFLFTFRISNVQSKEKFSTWVSIIYIKKNNIIDRQNVMFYTNRNFSTSLITSFIAVNKNIIKQ